MTDILPTILMAALCAMIGGAIGYASRNPKRTEERSSLHTTRYPVDAPPVPVPTQEEPRRFCSAYALYVLLDDHRYDIYRWEDIAQIHLDSNGGRLFLRLHSGEEHNYTEWCNYGITTISDVIKKLNEDIEKD